MYIDLVVSVDILLYGVDLRTAVSPRVALPLRVGLACALRANLASRAAALNLTADSFQYAKARELPGGARMAFGPRAAVNAARTNASCDGVLAGLGPVPLRRQLDATTAAAGLSRQCAAALAASADGRWWLGLPTFAVDAAGVPLLPPPLPAPDHHQQRGLAAPVYPPDTMLTVLTLNVIIRALDDGDPASYAAQAADADALALALHLLLGGLAVAGSPTPTPSASPATTRFGALVNGTFVPSSPSPSATFVAPSPSLTATPTPSVNATASPAPGSAEAGGGAPVSDALINALLGSGFFDAVASDVAVNLNATAADVARGVVGVVGRPAGAIGVLPTVSRRITIEYNATPTPAAGNDTGALATAVGVTLAILAVAGGGAVYARRKAARRAAAAKAALRRETSAAARKVAQASRRGASSGWTGPFKPPSRRIGGAILLPGKQATPAAVAALLTSAGAAPDPEALDPVGTGSIAVNPLRGGRLPGSHTLATARLGGPALARVGYLLPIPLPRAFHPSGAASAARRPSGLEALPLDPSVGAAARAAAEAEALARADPTGRGGWRAEGQDGDDGGGSTALVVNPLRGGGASRLARFGGSAGASLARVSATYARSGGVAAAAPAAAAPTALGALLGSPAATTTPAHPASSRTLLVGDAHIAVGDAAVTVNPATDSSSEGSGAVTNPLRATRMDASSARSSPASAAASLVGAGSPESRALFNPKQAVRGAGGAAGGGGASGGGSKAKGSGSRTRLSTFLGGGGGGGNTSNPLLAVGATITQGVTEVGQTIGHGVTEAAQTIGHGVTEAAQTIGHGFVAGMSEVGRTLASVASFSRPKAAK